MKHGTKLQQSIIDKRNAETRLINAKAILLEMECDSKEDEIPNLESENDMLRDKIDDLESSILNLKENYKDRLKDIWTKQTTVIFEHGQYENKLRGIISKLESEIANLKGSNEVGISLKNIEIDSRNKTINTLQRKLRNNRFWFITIAGILSGIALFMFLTLMQWTN